MKNQKGITLIELIVTLAILGIIIPVVYSVFFAGASSYSFSTNKGFAQQDLRRTADYLTKELRLITDINDEDLSSTEYYSLRINSEGDLVKSKHLQQADDSILSSVINTISGNWNSIMITNDTPGVIDIGLKQTEDSGTKNASYDLTQSIITVNSPNILNNLDLDLVKGDVLYFQNTKSRTLANDIYLTSPSNPEGPMVTVRFYSNFEQSVLLNSVTDKSGTQLTLPDKPTRSSYIFKGWNTNSDGSGVSYGTSESTTFTMPTADTDLYAQWSKKVLISKVTIDTNAGNDGVMTIDNKSPEINDSRFVVNKITGNNNGSTVKIKLLGYNKEYKDMVKVTLTNSIDAIVEDEYIYFKANSSSNGNDLYSITVKILTDGYEQAYEKTYNFTTKGNNSKNN